MFFSLQQKKDFINTVKAWMDDLTKEPDTNKYHVHWLEMQNKKVFEGLDILTKILTMAIIAVWTRYTFIPRKTVNPKVVIAGIHDRRLGVNGRPIIRFCYPAVGKNTRSNYSRLVIDPTGYPNMNHLHVPLSDDVVASAGFLQSFCQFLITCIILISFYLTYLRLSNAHKIEGGFRKEKDLVILEYFGALGGGVVVGSVGGAIGSIIGPVFSVFGQMLGSMYGAYYGLMLVFDI